MNKGLDTTKGLKQWPRPRHLDEWGPPPFKNEQYLFESSMHQKLHDALEWAGNQIGFLTRAALEELKALGVSQEQAVEGLKKELREFRRKEGEEWVKKHDVPLAQRDARLLGHLIVRWEAALGVPGEIMVNTPDRFVRRFYKAEPWYKYMSPEVLSVMDAGPEGLIAGINPEFVFHRDKAKAAGDKFDQWTVERKGYQGPEPHQTRVDERGMRQWVRPGYLDEWGKPPFVLEQYLFREPIREKHRAAMEWAGIHIAYIMRAALSMLQEHGVDLGEARERLMSRLRGARKAEAQEAIRKMNIPPEQIDARFIAALMILQWEACLGVAGEIMVNEPKRFLRRFYGGDPWDRHLTALILDIMGAEGEGVAAGCNPNYTFRTNRFSCGGDPFDEWTVEIVEEESVGRHPRIPE